MPRVYSRKRARIPATQGKTASEALSDAYERLGVKPDEVSAAPKITHILKEITIPKAIEYLRGSAEPDARKWLQTYDSLPASTRLRLPIEAFCVASGLTTKRVLELVTGACFEQSNTVAQLIYKTAYPDIMKVSVKNAKKVKGERERFMFHQASGVAPVPKTSIVNVRDGNVNVDNRVQSVSIGELGGIRDKMRRIGGRYNDRLGERLGIEGGAGETRQIEGVAESVEGVESSEEVMPSEGGTALYNTSVVSGDHRAETNPTSDNQQTDEPGEWDLDK